MGRQSFGTIDKRGTTSRPRYRARFDDPTYTGPGRAPRISAPTHVPTKREAEIWLASQWSAIAAGTWEHPDVIAARAAEAARQQTLRGITSPSGPTPDSPTSSAQPRRASCASDARTCAGTYSPTSATRS